MAKDVVVVVDADLIQNILVRLPLVSLSRFKSVCKSWCTLIQSPFFIHLRTNTSFTSSSSSRFGSFILHAAVDFEERFREDAVFMLSSASESESSDPRYGSWCSKSFGLWSTGFNGVCGECDSGSDGGSGWRWSTNDNGGLRCYHCEKWNNNITGGGEGGGGGELSNYDEQHQQQELVLKLSNLGFPSCYYSFGKPPPPKVMVVGSCNGLICLYAQQSNEVSLWNPATKQFRILPKPSSSSIAALAAGDGHGGGNVHCLLAFGFDDKTKDYKVVLLSVLNRRMLDFVIKDEPASPLECVCRVEVYSSSTDSWKLLEGITCLPGSPFPYPPDSSFSELFYMNGCCFFMAKLLYSSFSSKEEEQQCIPPPPKDGDRFMVSLDLTNEIVTPIELPDSHRQQLSSLCYLGKKIAYFFKVGIHTQVYGVNDSTCSRELFKICVFDEQSSSYDPWAYFSFFEIKLGLPGERNILRGISNDAVFALLETEIHGGGGGFGSSKKKKKKLKLYNLITKELKENFLSCDQVLSKALPYKPSQVWITGKAAAADMRIGKAAECSSS